MHPAYLLFYIQEHLLHLLAVFEVSPEKLEIVPNEERDYRENCADSNYDSEKRALNHQINGSFIVLEPIRLLLYKSKLCKKRYVMTYLDDC
jgi:hypothetical protein